MQHGAHSALPSGRRMNIGIDVTVLDQIDLRYDPDTGHPAIVGWTADRRAIAYPLPPRLQAHLIKKLAGYLATHLHTDKTDQDQEDAT